MAEFDQRKRDLEVIVEWMNTLKEEEEKAAGWTNGDGFAGKQKEDGGEAKWKENGGMRTPDPEKLRKKKMRETM